MVFYGNCFMKKIKYRNNNYNNQVYSINYKFDSISPAGKCCGTALDLIKRYNELAKEAQGNGNYVEAEVFRQYAEHYRKIVTEINERKNVRFTGKENEAAATIDNAITKEVSPRETEAETVGVQAESVVAKENLLVETKPKAAKKSFTVIEVAEENVKPKRTYKAKNKKEAAETVATA